MVGTAWATVIIVMAIRRGRGHIESPGGGLSELDCADLVRGGRMPRWPHWQTTFRLTEIGAEA
jgi:hypothetical protein